MNIQKQATRALLERRFCLNDGVGYPALGLATIAGAAAAAVGAAKLFDRYLSTHASACSGLGGIDRSICIIKSKIVAGSHTIQYLQSRVASCQGNAQCVQDTQKAIATWKTRIASFYTRLQLLEAKKKQVK